MKKNIFKICSVLLGITVLSSCLKDDSLVLDPDNGHNVVEFGNSTDIAIAGSTIPAYIHSYAISSTPVTLNVPIQYSGPEATAPQDIKVTVALGTAADLKVYNDEQHTTFEVINPSMYTIASYEVTIPKGQSRALLPVQFKTNLFDLSKAYALPLKISAASHGTISKNFGTAIYAVGAKNKYDGVYSVTGKVTDRAPTATANYMGFYPTEVEFRTVDENTIDIYNVDYGNYYYILINQITGGAANFGATRVKFNLDNNQVISVTTRANAALGILQTAPGDNQWDATSKKVTLHYTSTGAARYLIRDIYTYTGER